MVGQRDREPGLGGNGERRRRIAQGERVQLACARLDTDQIALGVIGFQRVVGAHLQCPAQGFIGAVRQPRQRIVDVFFSDPLSRYQGVVVHHTVCTHDIGLAGGAAPDAAVQAGAPQFAKRAGRVAHGRAVVVALEDQREGASALVIAVGQVFIAIAAVDGMADIALAGVAQHLPAIALGRRRSAVIRAHAEVGGAGDGQAFLGIGDGARIAKDRETDVVARIGVGNDGSEG